MLGGSAGHLFAQRRRQAGDRSVGLGVVRHRQARGISPVGQAVELRRFSLFSDAWNGSSDPWGRAAYRAGYQIAIDNGWDYTSGGIFIPTGSGTTYSTMMPLGSPYNDADVWVAPGVIPGS